MKPEVLVSQPRRTGKTTQRVVALLRVLDKLQKENDAMRDLLLKMKVSEPKQDGKLWIECTSPSEGIIGAVTVSADNLVGRAFHRWNKKRLEVLG